ncbi:MAG: hypothetical protein ABEH78_05135 [Haloferacaceae archaeon]
MSGRSAYQENTLVERMDQVAKAMFVLFGALFATAIYIDWQHTGLVVVPPLAVLQIPGGSNSGLFLLAIIVLFLGYFISKAADKIEEMNKEEFDQTQEWVVNIKGLDADPGAANRNRDSGGSASQD